MVPFGTWGTGGVQRPLEGNTQDMVLLRGHWSWGREVPLEDRCGGVIPKRKNNSLNLTQHWICGNVGSSDGEMQNVFQKTMSEFSGLCCLFSECFLLQKRVSCR